jgi:hypothetical protein
LLSSGDQGVGNLVTPTSLAYLLMMVLLAPADQAAAEWSVSTAGNLFYTDDVALFSATRRLDLHGDPTQPVLDTFLTGKGSDMVFEPDATAATSITSRWGRTEFMLRGQGFVYAVNPRFNQASVGMQMLHEPRPGTRVRVRYYTTPNLLLGDNESARTESLQEERVTSHIGSLRLEQRLSEKWELRLLTRYGTRQYNDAFSQRDTTLWTVGPHIIWNVTEGVVLLLGYHYERGLADGRHQPQLADDVSYINHYASLGLEVELTKRLALELGAHFERNIWTTGIPDDERYGGHEDVRQGEFTLRYVVTPRLGMSFAFQRSERKQSFEPEVVHNTNVSVGASYLF